MVERWSMVDYGEDSKMPSMTTEKDGDWVKHEDYEALEAKLARLMEAAEVFRKEAVVLSADYLKAFESYRDDDCIQGWDKARWIRALDAEDQLKAAIDAAKVKSNG